MADDLQQTDTGADSPVNPQFPDGMFEGFLAAVSAGRGIDGQLQTLQDTVRQSIMDAGGTSESADQAASTFAKTFREEMEGSQSLQDAADYARSAMMRSIDTFDPSQQSQTASEQLLNALSSGQGYEEAVERVIREMREDTGFDGDTDQIQQAFLDDIQNGFQEGKSPEEILSGAKDTAQASLDAQQQSQVPVDNPLFQSLADGSLSQDQLDDAAQNSGGDQEAFLDTLEDGLANGGAENAFGDANQAAQDTAAAKEQSRVELSEADQIGLAMAQGDTEKVEEFVEQNNLNGEAGDSFTNAIRDGEDLGGAMNQAEETRQQQEAVAQQQSVPMSEGDQLIAGLSGNNAADTAGDLKGNDDFANTVEQGLADGQSGDGAIADGNQAKDQAEQTAQQQSVPLSEADQLARDLASGNTDNIDGNSAGGDEFVNSLADGSDAGDALNQANDAQQAADNTAQQQEVPADPALEALAQGGDAAQDDSLADTVADVTGTTGGEDPPAQQSDPAPTETAETETGGGETPAETAPEQTAETPAAGNEPTGGDTAAETGGGETGGGEPEPTQTAEAEQPVAEQPAEQPTEQQAEAPAETPPAETPSAEPTQTAEATETGGEQPAGEPEQTVQPEQGTEEPETTQQAENTEETGTEEPQTQTAEANEDLVNGGGDGPEGSTDGETPGDGVTDTVATTTTVATAVTEGTAGVPDGGGSDGNDGGTDLGTGDGGTGEENIDDLADDLQDIATAAGGNNNPPPQSRGGFAEALGAGNLFGGPPTTPPGPTGGDGGGDTGGRQPSTSSRTTNNDTGGSGAAETTPNTAPTASAGTQATDENASDPVTDQPSTLTINLGDLASDVDGDTLTYSISSGPTGGVASITGSTLTFDPEADYDHLEAGATETVTIGYTVSDGAGGTASSTVTVTLTGTNDTPTLEAQVWNDQHEDAEFTVDLFQSADDVDDNHDLSVVTGADFTVESSNAGRKLVDGTHFTLDADTGELTVHSAQFTDLAVDESETLTVTYKVQDEDGAQSESRATTVKIEGRNDLPVISLVGDDSAAESVNETDGVLSAEGTLSVEDVDVSNTVSVTVSSVSTTGDASDIPNLVLLDMMAVDAGDIIENNETTGTINWDFTSGFEAFDHLANGEELDLTYTITVEDSSGATDTQEVVVTVRGSNDVPEIFVGVGDSADDDLTESDVGLSTSGALSLVDLDTTDEVSVSRTDFGVTGDQGGLSDAALEAMFTVSTGQRIGDAATTGTIDWSFDSAAEAFNHLAAGEELTLTVTVEASDGAATDTQEISVTITGTNDAPEVTAVSGTVAEDAASISVDLLGASVSDVDGDAMTAVNLSQTGGRDVSASIDGNGNLVFAPGQFEDLDTNESEVLTFTYDVSDGTTTTSNTVSLTVNGKNDAPTVTAVSQSVAEDAGAISVNVLDGNAADVDVEPLTTQVASLTQTGGRNVNASLDLNGNLTFAPGQFEDLDTNETEVLTFSFNVSDGTLTTQNTATITINGSNDAPEVTAVTGAVAEDATSISVDLLGASVSDVDGDAMTAQNLSQTGGRDVSASIDGNGNLVFAPGQFEDLDDGETETLTFSYNVSDGTTTTANTVTVTVNGTNDAPILATAGGTVTDEDFTGGASGWTNSSTTTLSGFGSQVLGQFAINQSTQKTFSVAGSGDVTISFQLLKLDTWDGETFSVTVNGATVASKQLFFGSNTDDAVFVRSQFAQLNSQHNNDEVFDATITLTEAQVAALPDDGSGGKQLTLGFTSTLNQNVNDESWAIDNLSIESDGDVSATGNEDTVISVTGMTVQEAEGDSVSLTLTAGDGGTVSAGQNGGGATISNAGSGVMTISGSAADVNLALSTLSYTPVGDFTGISSIAVSATDGRLTSTETYPITVNNVNDAPTLSVDAGHTTVGVNEDTAVAIDGIVIDDIDPNETVTVTLTSNNGSVSGNANGGGASVSTANGNLTLTGSVTDVRTALETASFTGDQDFSGSTSVSVTIDDGTADPVSTSIAVNVAEVNDAPTLAMPNTGGEWLDEVQVNTYTNSTQAYADVAVLSDGGHIITWSSDGQDGSHYGVYAQRYDADGDKVGSEFQVNTYTTHHQFVSQVAALPDGGFSVVWSSYQQDGSEWGVYGQRYDADGNPDGGEYLVNTHTSHHQVYPGLAVQPDGGSIVVWSSYNQDGSDYGMYGQRYDADGNATGAEFQINTYTNQGQTTYAHVGQPIATYDDGSFIVTWMSNAQDGEHWGIFAQKFNADGTKTGGEFQVNTTTASHQYTPAVTVLEDGGTVITWSSYLQDGSDWGIYAQRYDADGNAVGGEVQVNTHTTHGQLYSDITALDTGGYVIAWQSNAQDGSGWGIYVQEYDADGNKVGDETLVNQVTSDSQEHVDIQAKPGGGYIVAYHSHGMDGSGWTVAARTFEGGGLDALEDVPFTIEGIEIADVDAGDTELTVTLSVDSGTVTIADDVTNGLSAGGISGNGSASVTLTGTLAAINTTLAGTDAVQFLSAHDFSGTASLTVSVNDGGQDGAHGALTASETVEITIDPTNDAPEAIGVASTTLTDALELDGAAGRAEIAHTDALNVGAGATFTVEMWINPDNAGRFQTLLDKSDLSQGDSSPFRLHILENGGLSVWNGSSGFDSNAGVITQDAWNHVAVSVDGTNMTFYVNGQNVGSGVHSVGTANTDPWNIGNDSQAGRNFDGLVDDVRFWDSALDQATIQASMDRQIPDPSNEPGLLANITFDGSDGSTASDVSGNGNDATIDAGGSIAAGAGAQTSAVETSITVAEDGSISGTILATDSERDSVTFALDTAAQNGTVSVNADGSYTYTPNADFDQTDTFTVRVSDGNGGVSTQQITVNVTGSNDAPTLEVPGSNGNVAVFNGSSASIDIADTAVNNLSAGTIETWVYLDSNTDETIFAKQFDGVNSMAVFQVGQTFFNPLTPGTVSFYAQNGGGTITSNSTLSTGQWHHVAVAFDGSSASIYIDGELDATAAGNFTIPNHPSIANVDGGPAIGAWLGDGGGKHLDGQVGEFRVWETKRTDQQIQDNYTTALTGNEDGLRSLYNFEDSFVSGQTVTDVAGGLHGVSTHVATTVSADFPLSGITGVEEMAISLADISIDDVDTGDVITVQLTAGDGGTINVSGGSATISDNGTGVVQISGTVSQVNSSLATASYTGALDFEGQTTVGISVTDGEETVTETLNVTVTPGNEVPTITSSTYDAATTGQVLSLDGNGDVMTVDHAADLTLTDFTVEAWIKTSETTGRILTKPVGGGQNYSLRLVNGAPEVRFDGGGGQSVVGSAVNDGEWHHVAGRFDNTANTLTIFVDGEPAGSITVTTEPVTGSEPLYLGQHSPTYKQYFNGEIDEVRIWNTPLDNATIAAQHDAQLNGDETGLVAYFPFDDGTTTDQSQNNHTASLEGDAAVVESGDTPFGTSAGDTANDTVGTGNSLNVDGTIAFADTNGADTHSVTITADGGNSTSYGSVQATVDQNANTVSWSFVVNEADIDHMAAGESVVQTYTVQISDNEGGTVSQQISVTIAGANDRPTVSGNAQSALSLGGTDYVTIPDHADLEAGSGSLTVEMWFYWPGASATNDTDYLISKGNTGSSDDPGYAILIADDHLIVRTAAGSGHSNKGELGVSLSAVEEGWHHVAMVIDQSGAPATVAGYLDGDDTGWSIGGGYTADWNAGNITSADDLTIGSRSDTPGTEGFEGAIDEVRIWDDARTKSEIDASKNMQLSGNEDNLVGYWSFNESSGTTVTDRSGNGHDGTMSAGAERMNLVEVSIANNDVYKGLLLGGDAEGDQLSYSIADGPDHGSVSFDGNTFVYDHDGSGLNDSFTVEISDGTDTVTEQIDVTVV